jgi:hypothetical protein
MWKNIVKSDRPRMTIWHIRIICWIPKVTDMLSEHVVFTPFLLHERAPVLRHTFIASLVNFRLVRI